MNLARDASSLGAPDLFPPLSPTRVAPSVLAPQGQSECETTGCMRGASGTLSGTPDRVTVHTLPVLSRHPTEQTFETAEWGKRNRDQRRSRPCVGLHLRRRSLFGYDGPRRTKDFVRLIVSPTLRQTWPRELPEAAMCVQDVDVQCVLQFTLIHAAGCALHRPPSRVIHHLELSKKMPNSIGRGAQRERRTRPRGVLPAFANEAKTIDIRETFIPGSLQHRPHDRRRLAVVWRPRTFPTREELGGVADNRARLHLRRRSLCGYDGPRRRSRGSGEV